MAETLDTLAEKIDALATGIDRRFEAVDRRFDELNSGLRTQIEAVDAKVDLVIEKVGDLIQRDIHHSTVHARCEIRLEDHDIRMAALESRKPNL